MIDKPVKVLIADGSAVMRALLVQLLRADMNLAVVGTVENGQAAVDFIVESAELPDVVLMDIHMPRMDGFEATRRIMETRALPIVICTATNDPMELQIAFRAMEAGAVACVEKPLSPKHPDFERQASHLLQTLRLMSEVKVVRRWPRTNGATQSSTVRASSATIPSIRALQVPLVAIGASTGGPPVLQMILSQLPKDFAAPIVIVQHITPGFTAGLVEWLNQTTGLSVHIAAHGMPLENSRVYVAPDDFHLTINGRRAMLSPRATGKRNSSVGILPVPIVGNHRNASDHRRTADRYGQRRRVRAAAAARLRRMDHRAGPRELGGTRYARKSYRARRGGPDPARRTHRKALVARIGRCAIHGRST